MAYFIGADLGTSSLKLLLMDEHGKIHRTVSRKYPLEFPHAGWSQQAPEDWAQALKEGVPELICGIDRALIRGIGCGGQMHGLVVLDEEDRVIRPAILWNDGRTETQVKYLNEVIGRKRLSELTANIAFAGFTAPKLLWMRENEPENFRRIRKIMLPKDYINYLLTGVHACDYSDASGTLMLDVKNRRWSREMLDICGVSENQMPKLFESYECIGTVEPEMAKALGLPDNVRVAAGAGDNAAAAVGTGVVGEGGCNISLGTSGTVFISSAHFGVDPTNALHAFAHADGGYHLMGCMLSAASCNKWFLEDILRTDAFANEQAAVKEERLGENSVFFLPYLMGERSPINDTNARAAFIGMSMDSTRADMVQAVLEGVAFAIRDSVEVARSLGLDIRSAKICGGGAKSPLWKKIMANVLGIRLESPASEQGPGMGGAMLAMVACGQYASVQKTCDALCSVSAVLEPDEKLTARYERQYRKYGVLYPALKDAFPVIR